MSVLVLAVGWRTLPPGAPLRVPDRTWFTESLLLNAAVAALLLALSFTASEGPAWMMLELGESVSAAGVTIVMFPAGMALMGPVGGFLGDWWGPRRTAVLGAVLFTAPDLAMAMTNAPRPLLATTGASTSLARTLGFALGPALATLVWSVASYDTAGMRGAMVLATMLSARSVVALVRTRVPVEQPAVAPDQRAVDVS